MTCQIQHDSHTQLLYNAMRQCSLFRKLPVEKYPHVLSCLKGTVKHYTKGALITDITQSRHLTGVVISGTLELSLYDEADNPIHIKQFGVGELFGSELACSGAQSLSQLYAQTDCRVLLLDISPALNGSETMFSIGYMFQSSAGLCKPDALS